MTAILFLRTLRAMSKTAQAPNVSLRPSPDVLARLDALAAAATDRTGLTVRRGGVAMDALLAGLDVLEERFRKGSARRRAS